MKKKILLVYINFSSFVQTDYQILSQTHQVTKYQFKPPKGIFITGKELVKQLLFLVMNISRFDVIYIWFSDYHTLLPIIFSKIFKKKSIIISGGYDCFSFPSISYGVFQKKNLRYLFAKYSFKYASHILPVAKGLIRSENEYINPKHKIEGGILHFVKNIDHKIETVYTGFDPDLWDPKGKNRNPSSIITVASIKNERTFLIKGIDLYLETAKLLPKFNFTIIGIKDSMMEFVRRNAPENVACLGFISQDVLYEKVKKSIVYAQLSITEGLPSVVCEAMLAGCIPVGTNVGGIPDIISETGFLVDHRTPENTKKSILMAFDAYRKNKDYGLLSREFIISHCNIALRRKRLNEIIAG